MHSTDLFVIALTASLALLYQWLFRVLPREGAQFAAIVPFKRNQDGRWRGINFTFYGFLTACAGLAGTALFILLTGAADLPLGTTLGIVAFMLGACLPAAKLIAVYVEKNRHGFTIGGASFVGILLAPLVVWLANEVSSREISILAVLAAMSITLTLGEGLGRLACISFGCCYGKPLQRMPASMQSLFSKHHHVFYGELKKIAFAGNMQGEKVVPIQAISCVVLSLLALLGIALYFRGHYQLAFIVTLVGSQLWRLYSETLRADYRGGNQQFSAYQVMALLACGYAIAVAMALPQFSGGLPRIEAGFAALWQPGVLISLQLIWLLMFVSNGTSTITTSEIRFGLAHDWRAQAGCCEHQASDV